MAVTGTTENGQAAASSGQSGASQPAVSSGTASEAMIAAAQAASSAEDTSGQPSTGTAGSTTSAASGPAVQTEPSGVQPKPGQQPPATGQVPDHRIQTITANARAEGRREAETQYAAFKGMDPEQVRAGLELLQDLRRDPAAFVREVNARIQQQNGGGGGNQPEEAYPEPDLVSKDGQLKTYSHGTHLKALEVHGKKVTAQIMKELEPFLNFTRTESQRREGEQAEAARVTRVEEALKEVRTRKYFTKDNEPAILEILSSIEDRERMKADPAWALNYAYNRFLDERIFPTIDTSAEQRVRDSFAKKAAASQGTVNPTGPVGDGKKVEIKGQDALARHMEQLAAQMSA
jgi:hypothetical protein